jgi:uncharacterized protein (DUF58 family)
MDSFVTPCTHLSVPVDPSVNLLNEMETNAVKAGQIGTRWGVSGTSIASHPLPGRAMNLLMEPKTLGLLVAILFFLVSILNLLSEIHKNLGKLEVTCTLEVQGASSPQEVGKTIHVVRNEIRSTIANMEEYLHSFRQYRRKQKARARPKRKQQKSSQKRSSGK